MNYRNRGFDPEQFFGPDGPFGPRGPLGPGGIFGPQGPMGTGGAWSGSGLFGQEPWGGDRGRRGPRAGARRARRGDVRSAILELLLREPMNGYQLMQGIAEATDGSWTPSSGAIYPALAQLEDEGLVEQVDVDGRKAYQLTAEGNGAAQEGPTLLFGRSTAREPEDPWAGSGSRHERTSRREHQREHRGSRRSGTALWKAVGGVAMATQAVGQAGDESLATRASELLDSTRRELYRMLAEAEVAKDEDRDDEDGYDEVAEGEIVED